MQHKIISVRTKDNLILSATFLDGTVKDYHVRNLFSVYPQLMVLENRSIFDRVQVDAGGYGISWTDELDLEAETIWEDGIIVEVLKTDIGKELAAKLSEARYQSGITQKQLAERTGIYQADISRIERGLGNPSVGTLQRLAEGMGMTIEINFRRQY